MTLLTDTRFQDASNPADAALVVANHLAAHTYQWSTERDLQDAMAAMLADRFHTEREKALSRRDRPDFLVNVGMFAIAIEVKIGGARNAALRQVGRYAEHDEVDACLFATTRRTLIAGFPDEIHGKPVLVALLAGAL